MKKGKSIYFWYSASYIQKVTFIRWVRAKNNTGDENTNEIGIGAKVKSDFLFSKLFMKKVPKYLKRGEDVLRPYMAIYRTYNSAKARKRPIKRPDVSTLYTRIYSS